MIKKFFLFAWVLAACCAACDDDHDGLEFEDDNDEIVYGHLTGSNMHFYGTSTVFDADGTTVFVDRAARVEFAGLDEAVIYLHQTRFATDMQAVDLRIYRLPYTGFDRSIFFTTESIVPQVRIKWMDWQPQDDLVITGLKGSVVNVDCDIEYTCKGCRVVYHGRMLDD